MLPGKHENDLCPLPLGHLDMLTPIRLCRAGEGGEVMCIAPWVVPSLAFLRTIALALLIRRLMLWVNSLPTGESCVDHNPCKRKHSFNICRPYILQVATLFSPKSISFIVNTSQFWRIYQWQSTEHEEPRKFSNISIGLQPKPYLPTLDLHASFALPSLWPHTLVNFPENSSVWLLSTRKESGIKTSKAKRLCNPFNNFQTNNWIFL